MCRPIFTLSSTLMPLKRAMFWKVRAILSRARWWGASVVMSRPSQRMRQRGGALIPLMQLKMLVLPAPLGPMIAKKSPAGTSRLTPARAATPPKWSCNPSRASSAIAYPSRGDGGSHTKASPLVSRTDEGVEWLSANPVQGMNSPEGGTITSREAEWRGRYASAGGLSIGDRRSPSPVVQTREWRYNSRVRNGGSDASQSAHLIGRKTCQYA